jgi:molybdate transport system regulatory protein
MPQSRSPALVQVRPRLRLFRGEDRVFGPGQADLLEAIAAAGELRKAARQLGMSYMRAWKLVQRMNRSFRQPLVETERGGSRHGSARVTSTGATVLRLYREMEKRAMAALAPASRRLRRFLPR